MLGQIRVYSRGSTMEETEDLYELLGLPGGVEGARVQDAELRKAYRRRALEWHPDKRPNDASAAAHFTRIQNAYEVLCDEKARKAYDELQLVRQQRQEKKAQMSAKRQKMVDDLRQKEAAFELQRKQKAAEDNAARRLKEEIARIRAKNAQKMANVFSNGVNGAAAAKDSFLTEEDKERTLKVSWDISGQPGYTAQSLRDIFEKFGRVEDVLILQKKNAKKGSGLVVMESAAATHAATQALCGEISNPLLVVPVLPSRTGSERQQTPTQASHPPQPAAEAKSSNKPSHATLAGSGFGSREDLVLRKLREAQERRRIIQQMEEADAKDDKT